MQNETTFSNIISVLARSKTEAIYLMDEIDKLERSLYKIGEGDFKSTLEKEVRAKTAYVIEQAIGDGNHEVFLKSLREKVCGLTYLGLTIAFEPNLEIVGKIYTWVNQNVGEGISLDISINKSILGGAIIEYKGKIMNLTLLPKIDKYFSNVQS